MQSDLKDQQIDQLPSLPKENENYQNKIVSFLDQSMWSEQDGMLIYLKKSRSVTNAPGKLCLNILSTFLETKAKCK